jgi:hypothetical protein
VSLPGWTDDELLAELGAALREMPASESVVRAAQAAYAWRTVDADIELLSLAADAGLTSAAMVRGGPDAPRALAFHGERLSVEIEIDEAGIVGQLTPPQPGRVTLVTAEGSQEIVQADEVGCFTLPLPSSGPIRLDCTMGADHFITEWVTI